MYKWTDNIKVLLLMRIYDIIILIIKYTYENKYARNIRESQAGIKNPLLQPEND